MPRFYALVFAITCLGNLPAARAQDSTSPAGKFLAITITSGNAPFAATGQYTLFCSPLGSNYFILGQAGAGFTSGTYAYSQTSVATATATFADSQSGASAMQLVFASATSGTFTLSKASSSQSGSFTLTTYATQSPNGFSLASLTNQQFQAFLAGAAGLIYEIQNSSNLTTWTHVTNLTVADLTTNFNALIGNGKGYFRAKATSTQFAPAAITNGSFNLTITNGTSPLAATGIYQLQTGSNDSTYQVVANTGISNSAGSYTYIKTGGDTATLVSADSVYGILTQQLYFTSPSTGYFYTTNAGGSQSGRFTTSPGPVDFLGNINSVPDSARSHSVYFPADGTPNSLTVTNSAGWIWRLDFPGDCLLSPQTITMIPTASVDSSASFLPITNGVQLEPDGLQFSDGVTLSVTTPGPLGPYASLVMAGDDGSSLYFVETATNSQTYSTVIFHFTMGAVTVYDPTGELFKKFAQDHLPQALAAYNQAVADAHAYERVVVIPPEPPDYDFTCDPNDNPAGDAAINKYTTTVFAKETDIINRLGSTAQDVIALAGDIDNMFGGMAQDEIKNVIEICEFRKLNSLFSYYGASPKKAYPLVRTALAVEESDAGFSGHDLGEFADFDNKSQRALLNARNYYFDQLVNQHDYSRVAVLLRIQNLFTILRLQSPSDPFLQNLTKAMTFTLTFDNQVLASGGTVEAQGNVLLHADPTNTQPFTGSATIPYLSGAIGDAVLDPGQSFSENATVDNADICHAFTADIHLSRFGADIENFTSEGVDTPVGGILQTASTNLFFNKRITDGSFVFHVNLQNKNPEIANQTFSVTGPGGGVSLMLKLQHTPK